MVGDVCRFDEPLATGLRDLSMVPPDQGELATMKAVARAAPMLAAVCAGGPQVLAEAVELPAEEQGRAFATRCDLSVLGPLSAAELTAAGAARLALALLVFHALAPTDPDAAQPLARRMVQGR